MIRRLLFLLLVCTLVTPLGACGKKGPLEPPDGKKNEFPKQYPR